MKRKLRVGRKPLAFALVGLILVACAVFLLWDDVGLALFNFGVGNTVYVAVVSYRCVPTFMGGELVSVYVNVSLSFMQERVLIETVLQGYSCEKGASGLTESFNIVFTVAVMAANNVQVYSRYFSFDDAASRVVTCYLQGYDSARFPEVNLKMYGQTVLNGGVPVTFDYGGQFTA